LLKKKNVTEEEKQVLHTLKHFKTVIHDKLNDDQLVKLESILSSPSEQGLREMASKVINTRKIKKNAIHYLETALAQSVKPSKNKDYFVESLSLAAILPHIIDYCHRCAPQKTEFSFSEEEVKKLMHVACSAKGKKLKQPKSPSEIILNMAHDILAGKLVDEALLPKNECEDLVWYADELRKAMQNLSEGSPANSYLEIIKNLKFPQQKGVSRYFESGDSENFKKNNGGRASTFNGS
jgi:hypothetical protein